VKSLPALTGPEENLPSNKRMKLSANQRLFWTRVEPVRQLLAIILVVTAVFLAFACQHIGPRSIVNDRLAYNKAVITSWQEQTLLNIVRVRYHDLVSFVDVGSVSQTHSLMGTASATLGATLNPWNIITSIFSPSLTGSGSTTDSPLITYTPLTGANFTQNLNAPIKPYEIFNLIESGYRADLLLNQALYSINDLLGFAYDINPNTNPNSETPGSRVKDFKKLTRAIGCAHSRSDLNFYSQPAADSSAPKVFMIIADQDKTDRGCAEDPLYPVQRYPQLQKPVELIRKTLHLKAGITNFEIVAGSRPTKEDEIAVRTRSAIAAMRWLGYYVDLPEPEIKDSNLLGNAPKDPYRPFRVEAAANKPRGAFAAVRYRRYWFWIRENDASSKYALIYMRIILALADTGPKPPPPVLTIPTR
jgi:hypothetical protein